jgi:hypothetical protein
VIGWRGHAQLVRRIDPAQLQFIRPGRGHSDRVSFLSDALMRCTSSSSISAMSRSFRSAVVSPVTFVAMMKVCMRKEPNKPLKSEPYSTQIRPTNRHITL